MWSHGKFYWNELMTHDIEAAKKFYGETIGWTFESMPHPAGTYWVAKLGGESAVKLLRHLKIGQKYLAVDRGQPLAVFVQLAFHFFHQLRDLTGRMPDPAKFEIYLLVGQSNMAGRGALMEEDRKPHERILVLDKQDVWAQQGEPIHYAASYYML